MARVDYLEGDAMWLTEEEVQELTGYKRHADQRRWFNERAWVIEVSRVGRPIVSRDYAKIKTGSAEIKQTRKLPDFSKLEKAA